MHIDYSSLSYAKSNFKKNPLDKSSWNIIQKLAKDGDSFSRSKAIYVASNLYAKSHDKEVEALAWPLVLRGFDDEDEIVRTAAYQCAGDFQDKAEIALPYLIHGLKEGSARPRSFAADSIAKFGNKAKPAVTALVEELKNGPKVKGGTLGQQSAANALGELGKNAQEAVPALEGLIQKYKEDPEFLFFLIRNLYRIDQNNVVALKGFTEFESGKYGELLKNKAKYYRKDE